MLRNYFKIAWRNIMAKRLLSLVNVGGLFVGIIFSMLIGAYVWSEFQVNRKLHNADRQYVLNSIWKDANMGQRITTIAPLGKRLKEDYPNLVANYYRWDGITSVVSKGNKHFREGIQLGDSTFLAMYGFELLHGDARTALLQPFSAVITADNAIKYFGKTDVVGETITIQSFSGNTHEFNITGVLKDISENSVTQIKAIKNSIFIPTNTFAYFGRGSFENWENIYLLSYIELKAGITAKDLEKPIRQLIGQNTSDLVNKNLTVTALPLTEYYLSEDNGLVERMLYTLSFAGLFILMMAVINFVNISVSNSGSRTKEIGIRKVLGSFRRELIVQFLTESLILVLIATLLALIAYPLVTPFFKELSGKDLPGFSAFPAYFSFIPVVFVLVLGIIAGLYPALVLSSLKAADSLKGTFRTIKENILLRKCLVGFQFSVALMVLIAAMVVSQQVNYFFGQGLGYDKEFIVSAQVPRNWSPEGVQKMLTIRNQFAAMPQISQATLSYEIPNGNNGGQPPVYRFGSDSTQAVAMQALVTDENYLTTYQIPLKSGLFFDNLVLDSGKVVLNEKAVKALGYQTLEEAIGQQVKIPGDPTTFTIKGVVADFHFDSMHKSLQPLIFFNVRTAVVHRFLSFKIKPGNIHQSIEAIQAKWAILMPGSAFEYMFMDDSLKKLYTTEIQMEKAAYLATLLALVIVLLGIIGLVSSSIQKRVKEIGVRKVLGASVPDIILLFFKEFADVIVISSLAACPLVYLLMNQWLNNYAYRIELTPFPFISSVAGLAVITLLMTGLQTAKAALANPVKSLRTE
jgi:putative ABC transport system permease protein